MLDLLFGNGKIVARENRQVGQLAWGESSLFSVFRRKPTAPHRVELERFLTIQSVLLRIKTETSDSLTGDKPVEGKVRVVARNAGCVGACSHRNTHFQHTSDRRSAVGLLGTVSLDEILALKSHPVLHGDAAAECLHALDVEAGARFAVIEEQLTAVEGDFPVQDRKSVV